MDLFTRDEFTDELPYDFEYNGDDVNDEIPTEEEIRRALFRMRSRKAPGLTQISIDDIKGWYNRAYPKAGEADENARKIWELVVELIQGCIEKGDIPDAFFYGVLVLIPKNDKGEVRGIGLLESIHKIISQIINL